MIHEEDAVTVEEEDVFDDVDADFADAPPDGEYRLSTRGAPSA
ncbi:hypothetical protein AB0F46_18695 [Streptomyces sp. NPDC026665]